MNEQPERPYTVTLSADEIVALVHYHTRMMRRVSNKLGKMALEPGSLFTSGKKLKALHDAAATVVKTHAERGRGLLSIVKK